MKQRRLTPEQMDAPEVDAAQLAGALGFLRGLNRLTGGVSAVLRRLQKWSASWPQDRPVTFLDVATGSADIPLAVRRWGLARGLDVRITAIDFHQTTLDLARDLVAGASERDPRVGEGITLVQADALKLMERFAPASFDYVHSSLFLHHLPDIEAMTVLRIMERLSRRGLIWSDLHRSALHREAVSLLVCWAPAIVRHDGRVSVEAGFTRREVVELARKLDLRWARYARPPLWYRFVLAGERPGAWTLP